ncbi:hypothetical protein [Wenyingzhuangia sp. 2_MG-2023]|uniref:hypothetical protein n=1 Tax=Wenyingzhuangia sp. 2_MG-2023 TaxID=3062639 RepID=UPI0026E3FF88|nr:hypothetical protein [Wenyingzhuangia sp. 2_MG-2023]MDO6737168.1 hypothetical protein [Wenyingzhuangia sp. 2_MG-2023]
MMKKLWFVLFLTLQLQASNCDSLNKIRNIFQAGVNEKELTEMIAICKQSDCEEVIPYLAAATMKKAEFAWSPFDKLANFNRGKKMLENFIKKNPKNIEAKYIRWLTQKMAPRFLGYHNNLEQDELFILKNINKSDIDSSYQKIMLAHLKKIKNE